MAYTAHVPVRFGDVDYARIVYYPRLLHLLHVAFEELFEHHVGTGYASLMDERDPDCPIRRQVVPSPAEGLDAVGLSDPLDEVLHSPVKNVIRVYEDRIAFCVNNECALYCRFCLRKRMVGDVDWVMQKRELQTALDWIAKTPEIRDVLLTGGDPLVSAQMQNSGPSDLVGRVVCRSAEKGLLVYNLDLLLSV